MQHIVEILETPQKGRAKIINLQNEAIRNFFSEGPYKLILITIKQAYGSITTGFHNTGLLQALLSLKQSLHIQRSDIEDITYRTGESLILQRFQPHVATAALVKVFN